MVLRKMKSIAETYIGKPVSHAIITVPAYFNVKQKVATREAGASSSQLTAHSSQLSPQSQARCPHAEIKSVGPTKHFETAQKLVLIASIELSQGNVSCHKTSSLYELFLLY